MLFHGLHINLHGMHLILLVLMVMVILLSLIHDHAVPAFHQYGSECLAHLVDLRNWLEVYGGVDCAKWNTLHLWCARAYQCVLKSLWHRRQSKAPNLTQTLPAIN